MICIVTVQWCIAILLTCALYAFRDVQFLCRVTHQVNEGQQFEGCKTRFYVRPMAFEMYEGIFHNDDPLDWNPGGSTQHRMYASPLDTWRLTSVGGIHWPPRWVLKCFKYVGAISPMLNGFDPLAVVISRAFLSAFLWTSHVYLKLLIILFLANVNSDCLFWIEKDCKFFALNIASPAIVNNCIANMRKALNNPLL